MPQVTFLGPPYPTVDVPVFVPLGPSWDITLTPGVRGDWGFAPRLGAMVRGAPSPGQTLWAAMHLTVDARHGAAARFAALTARGQPAFMQSPMWQNLLAQRRALMWRGRLDLQHRWALWAPEALRPGHRASPALVWHSTLAWVSDDAVLTDLGVAATERVASYLPSRTLITLRHPQYILDVGTDGILRLDSSVPSGDGRVPVLSNLSALELQTLHRMPYAQVQFLGRPWGPSWGQHLRLTALAQATRYGALGPRAQNYEGGAQHAQSCVRLKSGVMWGQTLGPVRGRMGVSLDGVAFVTAGDNHLAHGLIDGVLLADGQLSLPVWRAYGKQRHMLLPLVRYRALARPNPRAVTAFVAQADALDPYLERGAVHQLLLGLNQSFGRGPTAFALELGQPLDLIGRGWLQEYGRLVVTSGGWWRSETLLGVRLHRGGPKVQHISQQVALTFARVGWRAHYLRASPGAERFVRTVYELSAAPKTAADPGGSMWAHSLVTSGYVALGLGLNVRYGITLALPKPDEGKSIGANFLASVWRSNNMAQNLEVAYTSPCDCWGVAATVSAASTALWQTLRMQVTFTVADTRLGN